MWKAFEEMEALGWVTGKRPKMYALQASGCAPVARAFDEGKPASEFFQNAATFAAGLRVPKPYGDSIILDIVRASGRQSHRDPPTLKSSPASSTTRSHDGIFLSPEGAAATAAYDRLLSDRRAEVERTRVVLFNTGAGLKYTGMTAEAMHLRRPGTLPTSLPVGGIITPQ